MSIKIDLSGKRFGKLLVIKIEEDLPGKKKKWLCKCDCGNKTVISGSNLQSGHSTQCKECQWKVARKDSYSHGYSKTKIYNVWNSMISRCERQNTKSYSDYGAKGICVCDEWHDAAIFIKWALDNGYAEGLEIDRIDTYGNYCPDNCRWIPKRDNANNKSNNKLIEYCGESKTLAQWARHYGVNYKNLSRDIIKGYGFEEAIKKGMKLNAHTDSEREVNA